MSRIRFWNESENAIFVRKTFYKNRFFGTRKMIKNVVKIFSSSQIFCLEVEIFPTSHVKFSKLTRWFCQLHTSSWPTRHVEFLHKTRLITHFMQSYLCGPLLKLLILSKTLCALRIEKIQPPLVSLANKRFSAGQFLQKSWQIYYFVEGQYSGESYEYDINFLKSASFRICVCLCWLRSVRSASPLTI